jgi:Restriction endonuclease
MYDLNSLGWHDFQQLCLTICREVLGQTVEGYLDSSDAGMDGAFGGIWRRSKEEELRGRFVIQCKFTSQRDRKLRRSDLYDEVEKTKQLVENKRCDSYILMTNAGVSGQMKGPIEAMYLKAGVRHFALFGSSWICQTIRENKRLRMMVPRVYGLGDLTQILDERAYEQARALLATLREDLSKVVITAAYRRAAEALDEHGFVLLIGEPAAGKTTIASMLAMAALDLWGSSVLKLDDAMQVAKRWNPDEPSQFFWVDDAFGVLQYESSLVQAWNHILPQVKTMLRRKAKIVMTSRDYIYNRARRLLKEGAFPLLAESQVVIDVRDLKLDERRQILYNHLKLGRQNSEFRRAIKPHLEQIAVHPRFIPETARRLAEPIFTKQLILHRYYLEQFVDKQKQLLEEVVKGLDEDSKAALALIYMRNDALESPIELEQSEEEAVERLGSDMGGCIAALGALKGSLVQYVQSDGTAIWRFKHPTVGDAFAELLLENPELLGIYVRGASIEKLMAQVTCGDVRLEHAVPLPKGLFPLVLKRIREFSSSREFKTPVFSTWHARRRVDDFLASRCSKEFLLLYLDEHPEIFDRVARPGLRLSAVSEVDLAIRLYEFELLPEKVRAAFVSSVTAYAIEGEDLYALENLRIQSVFTPVELTEFRLRVHEELLPRLASVRERWQDGRDSEERADECLQPLLDSFKALKEEFADEPAIVSNIDGEIRRGEEWISNHLDEGEDERPDRVFGEVEPSAALAPQERNIFDDVDE